MRGSDVAPPPRRSSPMSLVLIGEFTGEPAVKEPEKRNVDPIGSPVEILLVKCVVGVDARRGPEQAQKPGDRVHDALSGRRLHGRAVIADLETSPFEIQYKIEIFGIFESG